MSKQKQWYTWCIVILCSIAIAYISTASYFTAVKYAPQNAVFTGTTHYWQDGMFYLSQIQEGKHGKWANTYLYTEESVMPFLSHWPNILLGKICALTKGSVITIFHTSTCILIVGFVMLSYYALCAVFPTNHKGLLPFLFFITATSLMNKLPAGSIAPFWPYELWNTPHYIFNRFGTVPHYMVQSILFTLLLIIVFRKKINRSWPHYLSIGVCMLILAFLQPIMAAIFLGTYMLTVFLWRDGRDKKTTLMLCIGFGLASIYTAINFTVPPFTQAKLWEAAQQVKTTPLFLLKSIGPILPLVIIGMIKTIKKSSPIERFGMFLIIVGYFSFYSPIPHLLGVSNVRILFPGYYFFFAWFATVGLEAIALWLTKITTVKKQFLVGLLFFLYLVITAPTVVWEVKQKLSTVYSQEDSMYYLPKTMYQAFTFLEQTPPYEDIVLGNPITLMDMRIPALSGHKTVTGPAYATINYDQKQKETVQFFTSTMEKDQALQWIQTHHVSYVLYTIYDGYVGDFQTHYPFLTKVFESPTATVFTVTATPHTE